MIKKWSIIHQNIRSLRTNFDLILTDLTTNNLLPDIIVLSEIWIYSDEAKYYKILNYTMLVKYNDTYRPGGVAIYFNDVLVNLND